MNPTTPGTTPVVRGGEGCGPETSLRISRGCFRYIYQGRQGPRRRRLVSEAEERSEPANPVKVPLSTIARQWCRLGCIGLGGPPTHIALLRRMCVEERGWIDATEFQDAIAATNLLPGPASTQLAIFCAWRLRGRGGAIIGGACFIVPGLVIILLLSAVFLARHPSDWALGAASGAGAAVPAVALKAASGFIPASWERIGASTAERGRWFVYVLIGGVSAAIIGPYL